MRWVTLLLVLAVGLVAGFTGAHFWFAGQAHQQLNQARAGFNLAQVQAQSELRAARAALDSGHAELAIEKSTRQGLETTLHETQAELGRAHDQLAFFEQLFPPGPSGSVSLRAFDLEPRGSALQYRVLLMRNAPSGVPFSGVLQFVASGTKQGEAVELKLEPVQTPDDGAAAQSPAVNELALGFDQFQRSTGLLSVPAGLKLESVTLNVLEGGTVRVSRTIALPH